MSKKYGLLVSIVLLLSIATMSSATDIIWDNGAGDANWANPLNWIGHAVPGTASTQWAKIRTTTGPVFNGQTANAYRIYLESAGNSTLTMNSGSLTTVNHIYAAAASTDIATINVTGGAITIGGTFYISRDAGSIANINLSGGTITCNVLNMGSVGGTGGRINLTNTGKLIFTSSAQPVTTWIANGWIKAYGGAGTVVVDVDQPVSGKTTVSALASTKAGVPSPANNATNVSTLANLSWIGMLEATSHDVYFGTTSPGTLQGNQTGTTFDLPRLEPSTVYYWRIDERDANNNVISTGDVWNFVTGPVVATALSPANGAIDVPVSSTMSWTAGVTAASHNVYFGTTNPPVFIGNQTETTYNPGALVVDTTYYWQVDEVEDACNIYTGTVYSFTTEVAFKKGAYLIYPGDNTKMTVLWQLPLTVGCTIAWGTDTSYSTDSNTTTEYGTDHQHKYTITGLTPGTKYYYKVTAGVYETTGSFRAAPAADATSVKFFAYGDTRTYPASHSMVCGGINSTINSDPDYQTVLLHTGDWVNSDDEINWKEEFFNRSYPDQLQTEATLPIMGTLGNHEGMGSGPGIFDKYWPYTYAPGAVGRYYSFDYGPVHVAYVDQYSSYGPGSTQLTWLTNDLSTSTKKWKMIVLHQPGWTTGNHPNDASVQARIQPLCEQYGVQIVWAGHNHVYSRAYVRGVHHITAGGGGAPLYVPKANQENIIVYNATLQYCKISIDGNSMTVESLKPDGTVVDQFIADLNPPDFTFVQATDPQIGWRNGGDMDMKWAETVSKVNLLEPNFLIVTGDLVDNRGIQAQTDMYKNYASSLNPSIQLYNLPGNHDVGDTPDMTSYALWKTRFGYPPDNNNPWYSFTRGNNLFIVLDSLVLKSPTGFKDPDPNKFNEEMNWLTTTLMDANVADYNNIMVFMHTSLCLLNTAEADGGFNMPLSGGTGIRRQLLDLFHEYGVKAVFSGHAHYNTYVRDDDLEIITTSSSNSSLGTPSTPQGFRFVQVYPDHIFHWYRTLASLALLPGDYNGDGIVDFKDVGILSEHWLENGIWPQ